MVPTTVSRETSVDDDALESKGPVTDAMVVERVDGSPQRLERLVLHIVTGE